MRHAPPPPATVPIVGIGRMGVTIPVRAPLGRPARYGAAVVPWRAWVPPAERPRQPSIPSAVTT